MSDELARRPLEKTPTFNPGTHSKIASTNVATLQVFTDRKTDKQTDMATHAECESSHDAQNNNGVCCFDATLFA
jgi:hypothetical protein